MRGSWRNSARLWNGANRKVCFPFARLIGNKSKRIAASWSSKVAASSRGCRRDDGNDFLGVNCLAQHAVQDDFMTGVAVQQHAVANRNVQWFPVFAGTHRDDPAFA